jgi:hypothetical protein
MKLKEHYRHIRMKYLKKSALVEQDMNFGHHIQLHNTSILSTKPRYINHIIGEVTEISGVPEI